MASSTTAEGAFESQAISGRLPDWVWLGTWRSRLLLLLLALGPAWAMDGPIACFCLRHHKITMLEDFISAARQAGEPMMITFVAIAIWSLDRSRRRPLVLGIVCVLCAGGLGSGLKLLVGRDRPQVHEGATVFEGPVWPGAMTPDPSFPSGHTTAAFAVCFVLCRIYPKGRRASVVLAILCGMSRCLTGKHFLTDVLAGAWLGWEIAGFVWNLGLVRSIDALLPACSWYPRWNWETSQPLAD